MIMKREPKQEDSYSKMNRLKIEETIKLRYNNDIQPYELFMNESKRFAKKFASEQVIFSEWKIAPSMREKFKKFIEAQAFLQAQVLTDITYPFLTFEGNRIERNFGYWHEIHPHLGLTDYDKKRSFVRTIIEETKRKGHYQLFLNHEALKYFQASTVANNAINEPLDATISINTQQPIQHKPIIEPEAPIINDVPEYLLEQIPY